MALPETTTQPPVESPQVASDEAGDASPPPQDAINGTQPGAEERTPENNQEGTPAERTFSQAEVSAMESAKDREIAVLQATSAQSALMEQIRRAEGAEAQAQEADSEQVEAGEMTQVDANSRRGQRQMAVKSEMQRRSRMQQEDSVHANMRNEMEAMGRIRASEDFGKEYGIDPKTLAGDATLENVDQMKAKALELALAKAKADKPGEESFDSSHVSSRGGVDLSKMSGMEKIAFGLAHPPKKT
jgi:hypothetical protein